MKKAPHIYRVHYHVIERPHSRGFFLAISMLLQPPPHANKNTVAFSITYFLYLCCNPGNPTTSFLGSRTSARQLSVPNRLDVLVNWERGRVSRHLTIKLQTLGYWLANHKRHVNYRHTLTIFKTVEKDYVNNNNFTLKLASNCPKLHVSVIFYSSLRI